MDSIFVDTDVCLDLLMERLPHYSYAAQLFTLADKKKLSVYVSSLSFSNLNYLLSRHFSQKEARRMLSSFKVLVGVLSVDEKVIDLSLNSLFKDFEDAIQYFTAVEHGLKTLLTRNLSDYQHARIVVMTPEDFIQAV